MRHRALQVLIILTATLLVDAAPDARAQTGRVVGTVRNVVTNEPLANARVTLVGTQWFAVTDTAGRYAIDSVRVATFDVHVELAGFVSIAAGDWRVRVDDAAARRTPPLPVDFWLRSVTDTAPDDVPPPASLAVIAPGLGLGILVGASVVGGDANSLISAGAGVELVGYYGTRSGLSLDLGAHLDTHHLEGVNKAYRLQSVFIEPRHTVRRIAQHIVPYVSLRVDLTQERVNSLQALFRARGYALGGGGGVLARLGDAVALDGGVTLGTLRMGDFTVQPDRVAYSCMESLDEGTTFPDAVAQCAEQFFPIAGFNCGRPPFQLNENGKCVRPTILRPGTHRSGTWYRVWIGVRVALKERPR